MQDKIQKQILDAFFILMKPIARILLKYGIGYREFAEVVKTAFVDVATSDYGIRGRPTNISRVAVMTGLTRKEVRRIRDQMNDDKASFTVKSTPLTVILHRWHSEKEFLDSHGRPSTLPFSGEEGSFSSLVRKFGGDIPPGAMRTELKRIGAVEEDDDGNLTAVRRGVRPHTQHENLCTAISQGAYALLSNIEHNTDPERTGTGWGQKTIFTAQIRESDLPRISRICNDRIAEAAESFDDLFMAYESLGAGENSSERHRPIAIGISYFEEHDETLTSLWGS